MALHTEAFKMAFRVFLTAVEPLPTKFEDAGTKWAELYAGYAANAQADTANAQATTHPTHASIDTAANDLGGALADAFRAATSAAHLAAGMAAAFSTFWQAVKFEAKTEAGEVFATGNATNPGSPSSLQNKLSLFFSAFDPKANPPATAEHQAESIASLFDEWTRTVTVVNVINGQTMPAVELS